VLKVTTLADEKEFLQHQVQIVMLTDTQSLQEEVKQRIKELWQINCQQISVHDNIMFEKEEEMKLVHDRLNE